MGLIDFFDTKEYMEECVRRFNEGGTLWLIERTDTNEFYRAPTEPHIHTFGKGYNTRHCSWSKTIDVFIAVSGFLTEEDAKQFQFTRDGIEYGCSNCGYGGTPVKVTEHEFVK